VPRDKTSSIRGKILSISIFVVVSGEKSAQGSDSLYRTFYPQNAYKAPDVFINSIL
jgi:hypothetical protein